MPHRQLLPGLRTTGPALLALLALVVLAGCQGPAGNERPDDAASREQADPPAEPPAASPGKASVGGPNPDDGAPAGVPADAQAATVSRVVDGDTIWARPQQPGGRLPPDAEHKIRLLEYDAPEDTSTTECGGPEATAALERLIPVGSTVHLEADEEDTDRYGRFLRYAYTDDGDMVNLRMVQRGHGEAVLYEPNDAHIERMRRAEREAKEAGRGMWGPSCGRGGPAESAQPPDGDCDASYPGVCIPPPPPDLDCPDVDHTGFRVVGDDPHGFDGNHDGEGCET